MLKNVSPVKILFDSFLTLSFKKVIFGDSFILSISLMSVFINLWYYYNFWGTWEKDLSNISFIRVGSKCWTQLAIRSIDWRKCTYLFFFEFSLSLAWGSKSDLNFETINAAKLANYLWRISIERITLSYSFLLVLSFIYIRKSYLSTF